MFHLSVLLEVDKNVQRIESSRLCTVTRPLAGDAKLAGVAGAGGAEPWSSFVVSIEPEVK